MGLFDKANRPSRARPTLMAQAARIKQQRSSPWSPTMPGLGVPGENQWGAGAMAAYSAKVNKLAQSGSRGPRLIHTINRHRQTPDTSAPPHARDRRDLPPEGADPIEATSSRAFCRSSRDNCRGQALHREVRPYLPDVGCPAEPGRKDERWAIFRTDSARIRRPRIS